MYHQRDYSLLIVEIKVDVRIKGKRYIGLYKCPRNPNPIYRNLSVIRRVTSGKSDSSYRTELFVPQQNITLRIVGNFCFYKYCILLLYFSKYTISRYITLEMVEGEDLKEVYPVILPVHSFTNEIRVTFTVHLCRSYSYETYSGRTVET